MSDPNIVNSGESSYKLPQPTTTTVGDIPTMSLDRTLPRQVSTGTMRGTQTITGQQLVNDPTTNNPVITTSGEDQTILVADPVTKLNRIVIGKLPNGDYGIAISKPGYDVLTAFT